MKQKNIQALVESAVLIALSVVLSMVALFKMPMGGTVSAFSMVPLVLISLRWGMPWGLGAGLTYGIVQAIMGLENFSYVTGIPALIGVALLDYLVAFSVYGLAAGIAKPFITEKKLRRAAGQYDGKEFSLDIYRVPNKPFGYGLAAFVCGVLQFGCSFLSGIIIWGAYAPEDTPVWLYSLTYNGSFALPNAVLTVIGTVAAMALLDKVFPSKKAE
ncbi:MAG: energy-coupled thiamine transporter ThiT [Clostridium sp.]|jgi:thiamine transporter|nr:energy-coupled thiamine transporter ThiT [Clostridium sp.]